MPISNADLLYRSLDRMAGRHAALLTPTGSADPAPEASADRAAVPAGRTPARPAVVAASRSRRWWRRLAA